MIAMKKEEGREDCLHKKGRRRNFVSLEPYYFDYYEEGGRKKEEKDFLVYDGIKGVIKGV